MGFSLGSNAVLGYKKDIGKNKLNEIKKKFEKWTWRMFEVPNDFSSGISSKR